MQKTIWRRRFFIKCEGCADGFKFLQGGAARAQCGINCTRAAKVGNIMIGAGAGRENGYPHAVRQENAWEDRPRVDKLSPAATKNWEYDSKGGNRVPLTKHGSDVGKCLAETKRLFRLCRAGMLSWRVAGSCRPSY